MRKILLGLCLLGGALSLGSSPALAQVAASTVVLSGASGNTCVYTGITMQPNGGISVTCSGVAASPPSAPTLTGVTAGDTSASLAFTAGTSGSTPTIDYTASCTGGAGIPGTGASSPLTVTGLTNGTTYTCSVIARNSAGSSLASNTMTVVPALPSAAPNAPLIGTATPGNGSASIAFSPATSGPGGIIDYTATCGGVSITAVASPITVTPLVNGTLYTCSVTARNAIGPSVPSSTVAVTPAAPTRPGAPTGVTATPGNGSLSVAFTAPASNGGAAITAYNASCSSSDGGAPGTGTNTASPITVSGLDNGKTYTCTVTATNSAGTSDLSTASGTAVPVAGCGVAPAGTTIVNWTNYSNPGNTIETGTITAGASRAYKFTANNTLYPGGSQVQIETSTSTGGSNAADIAISSCPGVFTSSQPRCARLGVNLYNELVTFNPLTTTQCILVPGQDYYLNVRPYTIYPNTAKVIGVQGQ